MIQNPKGYNPVEAEKADGQEMKWSKSGKKERQRGINAL